MLIRRLDITPDSLNSNYIVKSANTPNELSEVLRIYVPRGLVFRLDSAKAFLLYLAFVETIASIGGAGDEVFETTHPPCRVLDPADEHNDGDFQRVYADDDGAVCAVKSVVDHIDGGTHSITATVAGNEDHRVCYVPHVNGRVVIRVESPRGMGELAKAIMETDLKGLHAMNQGLFNHLNFNGLLGPDYQLAVYVETAVQLAWVSGTTAGGVSLPFARFKIPVIQMPESVFYQKGEADEGAALRKRADAMIAAR